MKKRKIPADKIYAFWDYDLYPYILGGRVESIIKPKTPEEPTFVYTEEYGNFRHIAKYFTDARSGKVLLEDLDNLRGQKKNMVRAINRLYDTEVDAALRRAGIERTS